MEVIEVHWIPNPMFTEASAQMLSHFIDSFSLKTAQEHQILAVSL
jgi:hypothetical protein